MTEFIDPAVLSELTRLSIAYRAVECSAELADTSLFCEHYNYRLDQSANALLVGSTRGEPVYALCVLLAHCRLDTNRTVRKKLGVRRMSFATAEQTVEITGMELGGVTPFGMPTHVPVWVDSRVMDCDEIILGGGNRQTKIILAPSELRKVPGIEVVEELAKVPEITIRQ